MCTPKLCLHEFNNVIMRFVHYGASTWVILETTNCLKKDWCQKGWGSKTLKKKPLTNVKLYIHTSMKDFLNEVINEITYMQQKIIFHHIIYIIFIENVSYVQYTRGYQKVLSLRHFPHSDSTMLHT